MVKTVGVCGYVSTGSSAFVDLLHEFEETQVLDSEFRVTRVPDGLEDLANNIRNYYSSPVAIERFRKIMREPFVRNPLTEKEMDKIVGDFLNKIIQFSYNNKHDALDMYMHSSNIKYIKYLFIKVLNKFRIKSLKEKIIKQFYFYKIDYCIIPENFDEAAKLFVFDILSALGLDYNQKEKKIVVINQAFFSCDPVRSFKFFKNPISIIVDRDPRDHYLFCKYYLSPKGFRGFPYNNIDDYIKYFRLMRRSSQDLRKREDIMFFNFEELVYDYENTVKKVADFVGVTKRIHKGEFFKPTHSRNNTQLFKKYTECKSDIKKIEQELPEYIFPFENYPDIEPEGGMFAGSQIKKW